METPKHYEKVKSLTWNVIYHDINGDKIGTFNVFKHGRFVNDVRLALQKCKTRQAFSEELRSTTMYYFWSKCEWEVIISPWCGGKNTEDIKVDAYWQIMNNWEIFVDYIWNLKKKSSIE